MCLLAAITPFVISISPAGPTSLQLPVPSRSPLSLTGALTPIERASVSESSTCVSFLHGPRIDTAGNSLFEPITLTLSFEANWPGCESSFLTVSSYPLPKSVSKSSFER